MKPPLPIAATRRATTKAIGLFASSLTLLALGPGVPLLLRPWPTHWLARTLSTVTATATGAMACWAILGWVVYLGRLRGQLSTPSPTTPTHGPESGSTPD